GYTGARLELELGPGEAQTGLRIALEEGLAITGRVIDGRSQGALAGARVWFLAAPESSGRAAPSGRQPEGGRDRIGGEDENWRGGGAGNRGGRGGRGGRGRDQVALEAASMLASIEGEPAHMETDVEGYFRSPELEPGNYIVLVDHPAGLPFQQSVRVDAERGVPEMLVRIEPGEELQGRITVGRTSGLAGLTVQIVDDRGFRKTATTDPDGQYLFRGLLPGAYRIAVREGGATIASNVAVTVGRGRNAFDYEVPRER